ncbi:aminoglycoside phosphotransferase [Actinomadura formosensis]|uniref:aminoglycoside phosphotransferase n=2 Tax=Actinomadura formosensis TaxID=60706 RepID=UPI0010410E0D|nr:aminoglycoside phosphotransferase [Actinomadura formosensis]
MHSTDVVAPDGVPEPYTARDFAVLPPLADPAERAITADQTHRSVIVGERLVVKWFTPPAPPPHRALAVLEQLALAGFTGTARPYRAVFAPDGALVALVTAYLPEARDGWEWCVDAAVAGEPVGRLLGTLTADLHRALATATPAHPAPVVEGELVRLPDALAALDEALARTGDPWLRSRAHRLRADLLDPPDPLRTPLMRIHGDLHAGQILRWRGGHAVIDFDGNPVLAGSGGGRPAADLLPAARDVAQLLTSLEHVGQVARERRGHDATGWVAAARADFLAAYGAPEFFDERLVRAFSIEQECRELIYAARFLPRWRYAPLGVLRSWYDH